jgi:UDP-N-acetylmuramate dehydrogenase
MKDLEILKNESLKKYCTFKIGGNAKFVFICKSIPALIAAIKYCNNEKLKYKVIGLGANLLFSDDGFNGAIIVNKSNQILFKQNNIYADSGVNVTNLITKCYLRSLGGLENLSGIPATVGGAVVNNLGAFNSSFSDYIDYVKVIEKDNPNKIIKLSKDDCKFGYRKSVFQNNDLIILKVKLILKNEPKTLIQKRIASAIEQKTSTQPINYPSAGSIFKHTDIIPAKIIDELGLKGLIVGKAQISKKHAGFIVNLGGATSQDVKGLISVINYKVNDAYGKNLEPEIEIVE